MAGSAFHLLIMEKQDFKLDEMDRDDQAINQIERDLMSIKQNINQIRMAFITILLRDSNTKDNSLLLQVVENIQYYNHGQANPVTETPKK